MARWPANRILHLPEGLTCMSRIQVKMSPMNPRIQYRQTMLKLLSLTIRWRQFLVNWMNREYVFWTQHVQLVCTLEDGGKPTSGIFLPNLNASRPPPQRPSILRMVQVPRQWCGGFQSCWRAIGVKFYQLRLKRDPRHSYSQSLPWNPFTDGLVLEGAAGSHRSSWSGCGDPHDPHEAPCN